MTERKKENNNNNNDNNFNLRCNLHTCYNVSQYQAAFKISPHVR